MKAVALKRIVPELERDPSCLEVVELPMPQPGPGEVRIRVHACGVCHTELDEIEGRTPPPRLPVVLGHEVVGRIDKWRRRGATRHRRTGRRWLDPSFLRW